MPAPGRVSSPYADALRSIGLDRIESNLQPDTEALIIGAGPAGLSLGFELKRRGISFLILEKGAGVGHAWQNMPRQLKLVSPWKTNFLPGTATNLFPRHYQMSRAEFLDYLRGYANKFQLPVRTHTAVESVEKLRDGIFRLQTSSGDFSSRAVINATGYFSNPFVPPIPGAAESRIPQLHAAEYRDSQQIAAILGGPSPAQQTGSASPALNQGRARSPLRAVLRRRARPAEDCAPYLEVDGKECRSGLILIVGKRLSAGQIMLELAQSGFAIALSHRTPIQYGSGPLAWWFLFHLFPALEWLKLKSKGAKAPSNDVRMAGGSARKMTESGKVRTFPSIERFDHDQILFRDGQRLQPDLVLYATGFRPALRHLISLDLSICPETGRPQLRDLESVSIPGFYFLGLDHARNFQSRFLRGIRKDAEFLAKRLEAALRAVKV